MNKKIEVQKEHRIRNDTYGMFPQSECSTDTTTTTTTKIEED